MAWRSPAAEDAPTALTGARVMVVDDHPFTSGLVKDMLYACGAAVVQTARDGGEAISMLRACHPHLVVTDWRMPGLDGLAFTKAVRRAAVHPDPRIPDPEVPIVLLSAHTSTRAVEIARRTGVSEVVTKPFTTAALLQRIEVAMAAPRPFVVSTHYVGPDRRRRASADNPVRRITDLPLAEIPAEFEAGESLIELLQNELDEMDQAERPFRGRLRG